MTIPILRKSTLRYAHKHESVLEAAAALFNEQGLKGVTLSDVARRVGLSSTSVTYYFSRKEDLAAACLLRSIQTIGAIVSAAQQEPASPGRVSAFVRGYMQLLADIAESRRPELVNFHDMRALTGPSALIVFDAYEKLFRRVRMLLHDRDGPELPRIALNARTYLLLTLVTDSQSWIDAYESYDYARVARCMIDILLGGLEGSAFRWAPLPLDICDERVQQERDGAAREAFLQAATELVNEQGYLGASVERISARLNVTKGSFYHHNDSKDDLLTSCFERSFAVVRYAQRRALSTSGNGAERVCSTVDYLVRRQLSVHGPLLRIRALNAVPHSLRQRLLSTKGRLVERFAGMIFDGIADSSIRLVDPSVAAQLVDAMVNAAANLKRWVACANETNVSTLFARPLFDGLLNWQYGTMRNNNAAVR